MSKPAHITITNHKELYALQTYSQTRAPQSGMMHLLGSSDPDQTKTLGVIYHPQASIYYSKFVNRV